jgi:hypothetical protein
MLPPTLDFWLRPCTSARSPAPSRGGRQIPARWQPCTSTTRRGRGRAPARSACCHRLPLLLASCASVWSASWRVCDRLILIVCFDRCWCAACRSGRDVYIDGGASTQTYGWPRTSGRSCLHSVLHVHVGAMPVQVSLAPPDFTRRPLTPPVLSPPGVQQVDLQQQYLIYFCNN